MKVYSVPEAVPAPVVDYRNYDFDKVRADEEAHKEALIQHLRDSGYTGPHTGGICRFGVADGYAQYMLADGKGIYGPSFLIHLPYGDAWQYAGIEHFPKRAIVEEIKLEQRRAAFFAR